MIDTSVFKAAMGNIYSYIVKEKQCLEANGISIQGASEHENIDHLIQRTKRTSFKLLVMGEFSSGKSAFINVLLGEKLLPEGAVPMTALITEIYYGREKRIVMYPKKGKGKYGDKPFEIEPKLSEIKKYITINNKAGINSIEANRVDACFEKVVVYWPLEILKEGVVIVDSPGLNDPFSNDYIVQNYVPKADAILFCVNGTKAYSAEDKRTLQLINSNGFKNPIMVTTYFDVVTDGMDQAGIQEFMDICNSKYTNHTRKEFCHYINSKLGMEAKQTQSHSSLVESGYYELEQFLTKYLTEHKGREKIISATSAVKSYNKGQKKSIAGILANLDTPEEEFNHTIAETEEKLKQAKMQGELLLREFKAELGSAREKVKNSMIPELYEGLYRNISLDGFEPDTNFTLFHPKESSRQIADECSKELELRNKQYIGNWNNNVLMPMLEETFRNATSKMQRQFDAFSEDIKNASLTLETRTGDVQIGVSTTTRVAMIAYTVLTGDWITALMGGVLGAGAFGRTIVCQFTAGIIVGILSLFTPIGLAGVVFASLGALVVAGGWNISVVAKNIKNSTVKQMRKSLEEDKSSILAKASEECAKIFNKMENMLEQAIQDDIAEVNGNILKIKQERQKNEEQTRRRKEELTGVIQYIEQVDAQMDSIEKQFGMQ